MITEINSCYNPIPGNANLQSLVRELNNIKALINKLVKSNGTVTSVGLSMPDIYSVANSPITISGILDVTFNNAPPHTFLGNHSGTATIPAFVGIGIGDLPNPITWLGYVPENVANKAINFTIINNTLYPSTQAVHDLLLNYLPLPAGPSFPLMGELFLLKNGEVFTNNNGALTNEVYGRLSNSGGGNFFGIESSVGGVIFGGTAAYSSVIGTGSNRAFHIVTNSSPKLTIAVNTGYTLLGTTTDNTIDRLQVSGSANISNIPAASSATIFLTANSGQVQSRTASQVLSDIGAAPASGSGSYIQNQTSQQASSNFNISNAGVIGTTLTTAGNVGLAGGAINIPLTVGSVSVSGLLSPINTDFQSTSAVTSGSTLANRFVSLWTASGTQSPQGIESDVVLSGGNKGSVLGIISNVIWQGTTGTVSSNKSFQSGLAISATGTTVITQHMNYFSAAIASISGLASGVTITNSYQFYASAYDTRGITYTNKYAFYSVSGAGISVLNDGLTLSFLSTKGLLTNTALGIVGTTQGTGYVKDDGAGNISYDNTTITPTNRNITINGLTQDLSADRIYTITVAGTTNRVLVTNGATITSVIDISPNYAGQNTISILGTIGTGIWNGTPINLSSYASGTLQAAQFPALTGEATTTAGSLAVTLTNSAVIGKVLTGLNITGGTILAADSILAAFGKVQNQINGLVGGLMYQGTWNAASNSPTLTSSTGTKGYYYIISVAGSTNLDGITDWQIGDWAIFNGTTWNKIDNTDLVTSVFGRLGAVVATSGDYNTSQVIENTNLYFTNARAIASTLTGYVAGAGTVSSADSILTAIEKLDGNIAGLTSTYVPLTRTLTINGSAQTLVADRVWTITTTGTANRISVSGGTGLTPTIDIAATYVGQSSITTLGTITTGVWQGTAITDTYISSSTNWNTAYTNRITSLTVTGNSGASTLSSNVLNIPTYTLTGLGGQPLSTNLTSLSGLTYVSTSFVKMTASGTFSLDTNTYLTSSTGVTSVAISGSGGLVVSSGSPITTTGTIALTLAAIPNSALSNSTISGVSLGSNLFTLTFGTHLISTDSSYNGSAAKTISSDATNANTASTIVARDSSGNFSAGTITASLTGTASNNLVIANNLSDLTNTSTAQSNLGLTIVLSVGASSYVLPAGSMLEAVNVRESTNISFKIGTSVGGSQVMSAITTDGNSTDGDNFLIWRRFNSSTTLYFGGITGSTIITIYKR